MSSYPHLSGQGAQTPIMSHDCSEVNNESQQFIAARYYPMCQTKKWIPQV